LQNFYIPAETWNEAKANPNWLNASPTEDIKQQKNGTQQRQYAIDTWGSRGSRQWKMEANAFNAVCIWFLKIEQNARKLKLGIVFNLLSSS